MRKIVHPFLTITIKNSFWPRFFSLSHSLFRAFLHHGEEDGPWVNTWRIGKLKYSSFRQAVYYNETLLFFSPLFRRKCLQIAPTDAIGVNATKTNGKKGRRRDRMKEFTHVSTIIITTASSLSTVLFAFVQHKPATVLRVAAICNRLDIQSFSACTHEHSLRFFSLFWKCSCLHLAHFIHNARFGV